MISNNPSKFQDKLDTGGSIVTVGQKFVMIPFDINERVMLIMSGDTDTVVSLSKGPYQNSCKNDL